jgi:hypothetical protein
MKHKAGLYRFERSDLFYQGMPRRYFGNPFDGKGSVDNLQG